MVDNNNEINLLVYWNIICRRKIMLIALFTVSVVMAMVISLLLPKYYRSETVIMSTTSESGGLGTALSSLPFAGALTGVAGIQTPADKIMVILKSRTITEAVIRKFDLLRIFNETYWDTAKGTWKNPLKPPLLVDTVDTLTNNVTKISKSKEGFITIRVEWKDPQLAADMANFYVTALTTILNEKAINITIQVIDRAVPAERKSRPKIKVNMILAGAVSIFVGIFIALILEGLKNQKLQTKT